ncbi:hypothetical protein WJX73_009953 [Symbiochloris irregularis]|uniref:Uncharacterized protein n=1 Tax=Symbiochloris irregularis TaxID=706552 RepID=A0AAW1P0B3_9CHLO
MSRVDDEEYDDDGGLILDVDYGGADDHFAKALQRLSHKLGPDEPIDLTDVQEQTLGAGCQHGSIEYGGQGDGTASSSSNSNPAKFQQAISIHSALSAFGADSRRLQEIVQDCLGSRRKGFVAWSWAFGEVLASFGRSWVEHRKLIVGKLCFSLLSAQAQMAFETWAKVWMKMMREMGRQLGLQEFRDPNAPGFKVLLILRWVLNCPKGRSATGEDDPTVLTNKIMQHLQDLLPGIFHLVSEQYWRCFNTAKFAHLAKKCPSAIQPVNLAWASLTATVEANIFCHIWRARLAAVVACGQHACLGTTSLRVSTPTELLPEYEGLLAADSPAAPYLSGVIEPLQRAALPGTPAPRALHPSYPAHSGSKRRYLLCAEETALRFTELPTIMRRVVLGLDPSKYHVESWSALPPDAMSMEKLRPIFASRVYTAGPAALQISGMTEEEVRMVLWDAAWLAQESRAERRKVRENLRRRNCYAEDEQYRKVCNRRCVESYWRHRQAYRSTQNAAYRDNKNEMADKAKKRIRDNWADPNLRMAMKTDRRESAAKKRKLPDQNIELQGDDMPMTEPLPTSILDPVNHHGLCACAHVADAEKQDAAVRCMGSAQGADLAVMEASLRPKRSDHGLTVHKIASQVLLLAGERGMTLPAIMQSAKALQWFPPDSKPDFWDFQGNISLNIKKGGYARKIGVVTPSAVGVVAHNAVFGHIAFSRVTEKADANDAQNHLYADAKDAERQASAAQSAAAQPDAAQSSITGSLEPLTKEQVATQAIKQGATADVVQQSIQAWSKMTLQASANLALLVAGPKGAGPAGGRRLLKPILFKLHGQSHPQWAASCAESTGAIGHNGGIIAGLATGTAMGVIVGSAADLMQDFKTGWLTFASPIAMLVSQICGMAFACSIAPATFWLYWKGFTLGDPTGRYPAPFAVLYRDMAVLAVDGTSGLPHNCLKIAAGAFFAAILISIIRTYVVKPKHRKYVPIPMCLGIPAYIGGYFVIDMAVGASILATYRWINKLEAKRFAPIIASALIAGDGIWTVVSAILALAGKVQGGTADEDLGPAHPLILLWWTTVGLHRAFGGGPMWRGAEKGSWMTATSYAPSSDASASAPGPFWELYKLHTERFAEFPAHCKCTARGNPDTNEWAWWLMQSHCFSAAAWGKPDTHPGPKPPKVVKQRIRNYELGLLFTPAGVARMLAKEQAVGGAATPVVRGFALVEDQNSAVGIAADIVTVPFSAKLPAVPYMEGDVAWSQG